MVLNYVGNILVQTESGIRGLNVSKANLFVKFSPVYSTFENIFFNTVSKLRGYKCTAELEILLINPTTICEDFDELVAVLNSGEKIKLTIDLDASTKEFIFDRNTKEINYNNILSNNQRLGQVFEMNLEADTLIKVLPNSWTELSSAITVWEDIINYDELVYG